MSKKEESPKVVEKPKEEPEHELSVEELAAQGKSLAEI